MRFTKNAQHISYTPIIHTRSTWALFMVR